MKRRRSSAFSAHELVKLERCCFCHLGKDDDGGVCGKLEKSSKVWAHRRCMQYNSRLWQYEDDMGFGGFKVDLVIKAYRATANFPCAACRAANWMTKVRPRSASGAACGCAVRTCRKAFHFPCAPLHQKIRKKNSRGKLLDFYRVWCCEKHKEIDTASLVSMNIDHIASSDDDEDSDASEVSAKKVRKSLDEHYGPVVNGLFVNGGSTLPVDGDEEIKVIHQSMRLVRSDGDGLVEVSREIDAETLPSSPVASTSRPMRSNSLSKVLDSINASIMETFVPMKTKTSSMLYSAGPSFTRSYRSGAVPNGTDPDAPMTPPFASDIDAALPNGHASPEKETEIDTASRNDRTEDSYESLKASTDGVAEANGDDQTTNEEGRLEPSGSNPLRELSSINGVRESSPSRPCTQVSSPRLDPQTSAVKAAVSKVLVALRILKSGEEDQRDKNADATTTETEMSSREKNLDNSAPSPVVPPIVLCMLLSSTSLSKERLTRHAPLVPDAQFLTWPECVGPKISPDLSLYHALESFRTFRESSSLSASSSSSIPAVFRSRLHDFIFVNVAPEIIRGYGLSRRMDDLADENRSAVLGGYAETLSEETRRLRNAFPALRVSHVTLFDDYALAAATNAVYVVLDDVVDPEGVARRRLTSRPHTWTPEEERAESASPDLIDWPVKDAAGEAAAIADYLGEETSGFKITLGVSPKDHFFVDDDANKSCHLLHRLLRRRLYSARPGPGKHEAFLLLPTNPRLVPHFDAFAAKVLAELANLGAAANWTKSAFFVAPSHTRGAKILDPFQLARDFRLAFPDVADVAVVTAGAPCAGNSLFVLRLSPKTDEQH